MNNGMLQALSAMGVRVMSAEQFDKEHPGVLPPGMIRGNQPVDCGNQQCCEQAPCVDESSAVQVRRDPQNEAPRRLVRRPHDIELLFEAVNMMFGAGRAGLKTSTSEPNPEREQSQYARVREIVQKDILHAMERFPLDGAIFQTFLDRIHLIVDKQSAHVFREEFKIATEEYFAKAKAQAEHLANERSEEFEFSADDLQTILDACTWWRGTGVVQLLHEHCYKQIQEAISTKSDIVHLDTTEAYHLSSVLTDFENTCSVLEGRYIDQLSDRLLS